MYKEKQPKSEKDFGFSTQYGEESAAWLKAQGFTDYSGFNPPSVQAESTDFYMAKELLVSIKGLSSFPALKEVRSKIASGGKLTASVALMAGPLKEVEALEPQAIEEKAEAQRALTRKLICDLAQIKFAVTVGQVWFKEFSSLDENTMSLVVDGVPIDCKVEQKEKKITI